MTNEQVRTRMPCIVSTAADPRVTSNVEALARKGLQITAADPIGIYIAGLDDTGWSKPDQARPRRMRGRQPTP